MRLEKWALIAEIISAFAIVLSLIFVGIQISQSSEETALNTSAIQVGAYQELVGQIMDINTSVAESSVLAVTIDKVVNDSVLTPIEGIQYERYAVNVFRHADMAFYQYEKGIIDEDRLNNVLGIFFANWPDSLFRENWNTTKDFLDPEFVVYIETLME